MALNTCCLRISLLCLAFYVSVCQCHSQCSSNGQMVNIPNLGEIHGKCQNVMIQDNWNYDVNIFLGIPYAKPPIAELRFRKPAAAAKWTGVYNATYRRDSCVRVPGEPFQPKMESTDPHSSHQGTATTADPHGSNHGTAATADPHSSHPDMSADPHDSHNGHMVNQAVHDETESEDCLFLNVFVPANSSSSLPVLIWFPGHERMYDGSVLAAAGDVIVVTVSFRTGLFGFLSIGHPSLSGNYGLFDQRMAMQWVKDNIESFGGDSNNITIAGHGISGAMVGLHLLHDEQQSIFQRAISMSGYVLDPFFVRDVSALENLVTGHLKCNDDDHSKVLSCLQDKTTDELTMHVGHILAANPFSVVFGPTIDGDFLSKEPRDLLEEGHFTPVDYLLGGNRDDGNILHNVLAKETIDNMNETTFIDYVRQISGGLFTNPETVSAAILGQYLSPGDLTYGENLVKVASDFMQSNSFLTAHYMAKHSNVYYFQFAHISNYSMGGSDSLIDYVLGTMFSTHSHDGPAGQEMNHTMHMNHTGGMNLTMHMNHTEGMNHSTHMNHTGGMNHTMHMNHTGGMNHSTHMNHTGGMNHTMHMNHTGGMNHSMHMNHTGGMNHSMQMNHTGGMNHSMHMNHTGGMNHSMHMNHTGGMNHSMHMNHTGGMNHSMHMNHTAGMDHPMHRNIGWNDEDRKLSLSLIASWANFVQTGIPVLDDGIEWDSFDPNNLSFVELKANMEEEDTRKPIEPVVTRFWAIIVPTLEKAPAPVPTTPSPGHDHGDHTDPGHDHGDHTDPTHDHDSQPIMDMDAETAAEAVLALTIVVCFLFAIVVVMIYVNFRLGPKYVKKDKEKLMGQTNGGFSGESELSTKM